MVQDFRLLWLALLLSVGVGTMGHSASFDCDKAATEVEIAICSDPELSALDQLAHELSKNVKLKIDYDQIESNYETAHENISEHIISSISKFLGLFSKPSLHLITSDIAKLLAWDAEWYSSDIFIIRPEIERLPQALIVYGREAQPVYSEIENSLVGPIEAVYSFQNSTLSVHHYSSPATNIQKYRWQNDCWRLIGEDSQFNFRGYNPNNERIGISINHLTGRAIYTFEEGVPINRTFDPEVWCIGDGNYSSDINFHDGKALD